MILIKKFPAPSDLETLKKEAEEQGLSDKDGYAKLRNPLNTGQKFADAGTGTFVCLLYATYSGYTHFRRRCRFK